MKIFLSKLTKSVTKSVNFQVDFRLINSKGKFEKENWIMFIIAELTVKTFWTRKKTLKKLLV